MPMPALRVRQREPIHEPRQIAISPRPHHQMPMIWHNTICQEPHPHSITGLGQHALKREIVTVVLEQCHAGVGPIEHVVDGIAWSRP